MIKQYNTEKTPFCWNRHNYLDLTNSIDMKRVNVMEVNKNTRHNQVVLSM